MKRRFLNPSCFRILFALGFLGVSLSCSSPPPKKVVQAKKPPYGVGVRPQKNPPTNVNSGATAAGVVSPIKQAQTYFDAKEFDRLITFIKVNLETPGLSQPDREGLWSIRLKTWEEKEDLNSYSVAPLTEAELQFCLKAASKANFKNMSLLKLAEGKIIDHKGEEAKTYLNQILANDPSSEVAAKAQEYLKGLETLTKVAPKTIGVVLPLTGKNARVAQKTLRGIQLGLGLNGKGASTFRLAVIDSEGNPELARAGIEKLYSEDNVIAVIGGLINKTAAAEAAQASEFNLPIISLSLKNGITDMGPYVMRNSLTLEMQIRHLVKTAMEDLGYKRFGILYPNDSYGVEAANFFWDEVSARGGQINASQTYSTKDTDFRDVIQRLVGTYFSEARQEESKLRLKELSELHDKKAKAARSNTKDDLLPPLIQFDAIFIPDSLKSLNQLSATLSYSDVRNVKLLGTNLWNSAEVGKRSGNFNNSLLFVDSYNSTDPGFQNLLFVKEYKLLFNEDPGLFEIQGYDTGLVLRQLISQGASDRESLAQALRTMDGVPGLLSSMKASEDREISRPIMALSFENSQIVPFKVSTKK